MPIRRGDCPDLPKPGWTGEFEWEGVVPYEEMPAVQDPECGYVITANNRIAPDDFPHHISSDYLDGYRARRIEALLLAQPEHDAESFEAMQSDNYSIPGGRVGPPARPAAAPRPAGGERDRAAEELGRAARARTRSPLRFTRRSRCGSPARSRDRRSATAI